MRGVWVAIVGLLLLGLVPACGRVRTVPLHVRSALDCVAFLEGCWNYWSVDAGVHLCWRREGDAWVGWFEHYGPMALPSRDDLRIELGVEQLELTEERRRPASSAVMASSDSSHIAFESSWGFWLVDGRLFVRPRGWGDFRYEMHRVPSRARSD
jgi:hypothetical protein